MLQLIAIICGLVILVYLPIEARKVASGWTRPSFKGTPDEFRVVYRKQITYFMWVGVGIGGANVVVALLNQDDGNWIFFLLGAAIWLGTAAIALYLRGKFASTQPV